MLEHNGTDSATWHHLAAPMGTGEAALFACQAARLLGKGRDPGRKPFPNSEAALERGSPTTCPASDYSALRQDGTRPGAKDGSLVATDPELLLPGSDSTPPRTRCRGWVCQAPRLRHLLGPWCLAIEPADPGPSSFPAVLSLQPARLSLCGASVSPSAE